MLKYWRIWLLLIFILGAVLAIGLKPRVQGIEVVYVTKDSPMFGELEQGMIISSINGVPIKTVDDWERHTKDLKGSVAIVADGVRYETFVNDTLGIETQEYERLNIDFGLDLKGGTRIILKPTENATKSTIDQVISTLQTRINIYGLQEIKFHPVSAPDGWRVQIEATGLGSGVVDDLLSSKGAFEAIVSKPVELRGGKGDMQLGSSHYPVEVSNGTVIVNGMDVSENGTFFLEDIEFDVGNITSDTIFFMASVYKGDDIELIYTDPQHSGITPAGDIFKFYFTILVSSDGSKRFAMVTSGIPSRMDLDTGEYYLKDSEIFLFLDNELQSNLRIASSLGGKEYSTPQITGGRARIEDAATEKMKLQTILRSGALPVSMETESISIISPTLGANFIQSAGVAALVAGLAVVVIVFIRYRSLKTAVPLVLTGFSEAVIILGISATGAFDMAIWSGVFLAGFFVMALAWWKLKESDVLGWVGLFLISMFGMTGWNIDLPAIGGIIAAIGVGVDQMVVIADETLGGRKMTRVIYSLKEKIGKALFIIFTAAITTIFALVPLLFVTAGVVIRGFIITTIVGILTGILITRPAYAKIVEIGAERESRKQKKGEGA